MTQLRQMFSTVIMSLPALLNVGCLWSLVLFIYAVLGVNFFFDVCTVPPPQATALDPADPCPDPAKLGFTGFVSLNATASIAAYDSGVYTADDAVWMELCVPAVLACGADYHHVWKCEDPAWPGTPLCEGDGAGAPRSHSPHTVKSLRRPTKLTPSLVRGPAMVACAVVFSLHSLFLPFDLLHPCAIPLFLSSSLAFHHRHALTVVVAETIWKRVFQIFIFARAGNVYHECVCENTAVDGNFYSFGDAFLTLIRFSTGEYWNGLMHDAMGQGHTLVFLYYGSYVVISTMVILNLLIASIVSNWSETKEVIARGLNSLRSCTLHWITTAPACTPPRACPLPSSACQQRQSHSGLMGCRILSARTTWRTSRAPG